MKTIREHYALRQFCGQSNEHADTHDRSWLDRRAERDWMPWYVVAVCVLLCACLCLPLARLWGWL